MARIGVLGSTGMLGSALTRVLSSRNHEVIEFNRSGQSVVGNKIVKELDATWTENQLEVQILESEVDYLVNAIGLIKQVINEADEESVKFAKQINAEFPKKINSLSIANDIPVIQIGTDCVFSGARGHYTEIDEYSPVDLYGRTKASGELESGTAMTIRSSIVGSEIASNNSLLNWVLSQPLNGKVNGYSNHFWNGVTTLAFAKVVAGVIENDRFKPGLAHLIPKDFVSKKELITIMAQAFQREDLVVEDFPSETPINRTLATIDSSTNAKFWSLAGYNQIPNIAELIQEFAHWD
ncbi:RfbD dTDP-4-dehydrorhamnose reductase [Candidatus Planktophila dulcis]|uniref:sugar nucleotide-binding protein n=1 Tax=Candidatus Planktophila dulcis TaxID=1884914 RepID=UPI003BEF2A5B